MSPPANHIICISLYSKQLRVYNFWFNIFLTPFIVKPLSLRRNFTKLNNSFCSGHLSAVAAAALQFLRNFSGREETTNSTSEPAAALDSQCVPRHIVNFYLLKILELARSFKSPHLKTIHCIYILNTKSQKTVFFAI